MESRPLGSLLVSPLCLGTMNLGGVTGKRDSIRLVQRALDGGIDFFDTAPTYNAGASERLLGKALRKARCRERVVVATKVFLQDGAVEARAVRPSIIRACEQSLRRLKLDCIDLYQLHRPLPSVPQEEVLRAFDDLVRAGKVRLVGCSTHPAATVAEALAISAREGLVRYSSEQPPYNLLDRRIERELVPLCRREGLAILPWSPLAGGLLAGRYPDDGSIPKDSRAARVGRYRERVTVAARRAVAGLAERARERGLSCAQLALLWIRDQPGVTAPIVGPRTLAHLEEALEILDRSLDDADRHLCDELVPPETALVEFA